MENIENKVPNGENQDMQNSSFFSENVSSSNGLEPSIRFKNFCKKWENIKLKEVGTFQKGAPLSKADISQDGKPFILYGELYTTYDEVTYNVVRKTNKEVESIYLSNVGDVIIPTSGETPEEIATATCVMVPDVILAGDLYILRQNKIDGRILSYIINHVVNEKISRVAQGKSVVHVRAEELGKIAINYPSLPEQQKIANFLSLVDQRIEKQRQLVEALKKYKRGAFQHIYRNKLINWEKKIVNDFSPVYGGYAFDSKCYDENGSLNIITIGNVTGKRYISMDCNRIKDIPLDLQEHQYLKKGDIVISMTGNVGRVSLVNADNCLLNQRVAKIVIKDVYLKEYIYQVLSSSGFEQEMNNKGQGAAQKNIKNSDIENFIFYMPVDQNKIEEISMLLYCLDTLIDKSENIIDALISTKNGLLQQMFI